MTSIITPDWPAPPNVVAGTSTKLAPDGVLPCELRYLNQVHGATVVPIETVRDAPGPVNADAVTGRTPGARCAVRTADCLSIRNFEPDRWPAGTPDHPTAHFENAWLADCDNGPTKTYLWEHRNDPEGQRFYELSFAKRPAEELYDLGKDPAQVTNVASDPAYAETKKKLADQLMTELEASGDPRVKGEGGFFDQQEYLGGAPKWPGE